MVKAAVRKAVRDINSKPRDAQERFVRLLFSQFGIGRNNLLLANSLKELMYAIPHALQPRNVLIIGPAITLYRDAVRSAGARMEFLLGAEETGYLPDLSAIVTKVSGFDMVCVANPNRITGKAIDDRTLTGMVARLPDENCLLVIDETLMEFTRQKSFMERLPVMGNIIVLRTTACYYGLAGLELAYAASSEAVIAALRERTYWDLNLPAVVAARTAMKDKAFSRLTDKFIDDEKHLLQRAVSKMQGIGLYGSDANVLLFKPHDCMAAVAQMAGKAGLAVERYAGPHGFDTPLLGISIMRHEHNLRLIKIMQQVCREKNSRVSG